MRELCHTKTKTTSGLLQLSLACCLLLAACCCLLLLLLPCCSSSSSLAAAPQLGGQPPARGDEQMRPNFSLMTQISTFTMFL